MADRTLPRKSLLKQAWASCALNLVTGGEAATRTFETGSVDAIGGGCIVAAPCCLRLASAGWPVTMRCAAMTSFPRVLRDPSEVWWLRLHGAALLGFLVAFGALLPRHIADGWRHGLNRDSGLAVIANGDCVDVDGYGLYYATGDTIHGLGERGPLEYWLGLVRRVDLACRPRAIVERRCSQARAT